MAEKPIQLTSGMIEAIGGIWSENLGVERTIEIIPTTSKPGSPVPEGTFVVIREHGTGHMQGFHFPDKSTDISPHTDEPKTT